MDLNYFFAHDKLFPKCNCCIVLDYPRLFCLSMLILRHFDRTWFAWWYSMRDKDYKHQSESFEFVLPFAFWRDESYIRWQWFVQSRYRNEMEARFDEWGRKKAKLIRIDRPHIVDQWLS